ncbi:MAG: transglycosylase domain-containing protein [Elusimicrobia bacterium]|nr:transglycosylase domain-containing protein [Elusimicrobiota bacterium]
MPRRRFYLLALLALVCVIAAGGALRTLLAGLPSTHSLDEYTPSLTTRIFDSTDELVAELSIEKRALLPLAKIPVDLQNAVLAIEDDRFFKHWGVSPRGILRSAAANFLAGRIAQGGSTITQQLSKQIFLTRERTIARKIREILLAVQIEREFSKQEILQLYLNQVYFGEGAYGVQSAARNYFGKEVSELKLAECALLAGVIRAPRGYSPFSHQDRARRRRATVLERMQSEGFINEKEKKEALATDVPLVKPLDTTIQAPYFVEHVRSRLERKYGTSSVWRGGMKVYTTLDLKMQRIAEEVMEKGLTEFDEKAAKDWEAKLKEDAAEAEEGVEVSTTLPKIQGAFVVMDVKTGAIRAMIGGRDSKFNRAVQAYRQPGSTFKPFVWAAALNAGMTGASLIEDNPLAFYFDGRDWRLLEGATDQYSIDLATAPFAESPDFKIWVPNDFDGKFMGVITLRKALALSRNIASINLINQIGPPLVVDIAHRAGIRSELEPVPALGLGSSVVSPLEMTSAFSTFANGGIYVQPYTVDRVEDSQGKELERYVPTEREAMSPQVAFLMTNLLKAVVAGGTGRYARFLQAKHPMAGKTGTSNDNRDLWFIGYTPDLVAGAWMGYDDFGSLGKKDWTGGSTVVPWWTAIMEQVLKDSPKRDFPIPPGISDKQTICADTGLLALPSCPRKVQDYFIEGTQPTQYCESDHSLPLALTVPGAPGAAALPSGSTSHALGGEDGLLPLPTESELDAQPETEEPNIIE